MNAVRPNPLRWERTLVLAAALISLAAFFWQIWGHLDYPWSPFGTARVPVSDALEPWLHGSLSYYFHHEPTPMLYRPTVGLIFSSLLSSFGSLHLDWIPVFFACFLFATLALYFWSAPPALAAPVVLLLVFSALEFGKVVTPLNVGTLHVDFLSFVVTFSGLLFFILAFGRHPVSLVASSVGFLLLGMAAAIRGPLMLGGPVLLLGALFFLPRRVRARGILLFCACFFFPLVVDWTIQKSHGLVNNGLIACFSFYSDPQHTWTAEANAAYDLLKLSPSEVLVRYGTFVSSPEGLKIVSGYFFQQLYSDASLVVASRNYVVVLLALLCVPLVRGGWSSRQSGGNETPSSGGDKVAFRGTLIVRVIVPSLLLLLIALVPGAGGLLATALVSWMIIASIWLRLHFAAACLLTYSLSLLFLSLLGFAWLPRLSLTTSFCLPLGLYFFLLQNPTGVAEAGPARPLFASSLAAAGILLWLYVANFLVPTPVKRTFHEKVDGRSAAIKISNGPEFDRSLYYTGDRQLLYTFADPSLVGTVRQYERIETPSGQNPEPPPAGSNSSFRAPVKFQ
jgi:hypothetical protein